MEKLFLIVLYDCHWLESVTFKSLVNADIDLSEHAVVLWNNGPTKYEINDDADFFSKFKSVSIYQTEENFSLSRIYNFVIDNYVASHYVILDHDSELTSEYLVDVNSYHADGLAVPYIEIKQGDPSLEDYRKELKFPRIYGERQSVPLSPSDRVETVGSGLVISYEIINMLKNVYGSPFDIDFSLYCVDISFLTRIADAGLSDRIVFINKIYHSYSTCEIESHEKKKFRITEKSIGRALLIKKYYFQKYGYYKLFYKFKKIIEIGLSSSYLYASFDTKTMLKYYFMGHHPNQVEIIIGTNVEKYYRFA